VADVEVAVGGAGCFETLPSGRDRQRCQSDGALE
jgi:hypothetical protein